MTAAYLLDTNILSDLLRHPQGVVAKRIAEVGEDAICTSIIVAAELRYGAAKRQSERLIGQLDLILSRVAIQGFDARWTKPMPPFALISNAPAHPLAATIF